MVEIPFNPERSQLYGVKCRQMVNEEESVVEIMNHDVEVNQRGEPLK
jgi:hypothetical protein